MKHLFVTAVFAWVVSVIGAVCLLTFGRGMMAKDDTALLAIFLLACALAIFIGTSIYLIMAWAVRRAR
jgi:hypothetical protein